MVFANTRELTSIFNFLVKDRLGFEDSKSKKKGVINKDLNPKRTVRQDQEKRFGMKEGLTEHLSEIYGQ